jgi:hypothetical protein
VAIQDLNKKISAKKRAKKKVAKTVDSVSTADLVAAIEKIQQPVVNIEARKPVSYRFSVNIDRSTGTMSGGRIDPILEE